MEWRICWSRDANPIVYSGTNPTVHSFINKAHVLRDNTYAQLPCRIYISIYVGAEGGFLSKWFDIHDIQKYECCKIQGGLECAGGLMIFDMNLEKNGN